MTDVCPMSSSSWRRTCSLAVKNAINALSFREGIDSDQQLENST